MADAGAEAGDSFSAGRSKRTAASLQMSRQHAADGSAYSGIRWVHPSRSRFSVAPRRCIRCSSFRTCGGLLRPPTNFSLSPLMFSRRASGEAGSRESFRRSLDGYFLPRAHLGTRLLSVTTFEGHHDNNPRCIPSDSVEDVGRSDEILDSVLHDLLQKDLALQARETDTPEYVDSLVKEHFLASGSSGCARRALSCPTSLNAKLVSVHWLVAVCTSSCEAFFRRSFFLAT